MSLPMAAEIVFDVIMAAAFLSCVIRWIEERKDTPYYSKLPSSTLDDVQEGTFKTTQTDADKYTDKFAEPFTLQNNHIQRTEIKADTYTENIAEPFSLQKQLFSINRDILRADIYTEKCAEPFDLQNNNMESTDTKADIYTEKFAESFGLDI